MFRLHTYVFSLLAILAILMSACQPIQLANAVAAKALAQREITEIESGGNLALVDELFAEDFVLHFPGYPPMDREGFKMLIDAFRSGFPDLTVSLEEQVVEGNKVTNRVTIRGTHQGDFNGVPASGKSIEVPAINTMRIENGQIHEIWGLPDVLGLMMQIGAIPMPGAQPPAKNAAVIPGHGEYDMNVLGHDVKVKITSADSAGAYYVFEIYSPQGAFVPPHIHSHEDEIIQVVEGEYEVILGDQLYTVKAGDTLHFPRGVAHGFTHTGAGIGKTLWIVAPGASFEEFFTKLGALPAGPPDPVKLGELFGEYGIELPPPPQTSDTII
jgi:steroid delta-isomerase-like uncharacterized protein